MLNENNALIFNGLIYPYQPQTGDPWTADAVTAFIVEHTHEQAEPMPITEVVRVDKVRFKNVLLTTAELAAFNRATKTVAAVLSDPAAYDDPANALHVQAEMLLDYLADISVIELNHPKTVQGVSEVLVGLGVLTAARAAQVLANESPGQ